MTETRERTNHRCEAFTRALRALAQAGEGGVARLREEKREMMRKMKKQMTRAMRWEMTSNRRRERRTER